MTGIYKIESQINPGRTYIGSAVNIRHRWECHLSDLRKSKHPNRKLQNHFNKYGTQDLIFIIVELCFPEFLTAREQYYINKLKPWFNICKMAGSQLGMKRSEEAKKRMSESHIGKHLSEKTKQKIGEFNKGKHISTETKRRLSESKKGKNNPAKRADVREKIREARKKQIAPNPFKKGNIPWNKGKKGVQIPWNKGMKKNNRLFVA